MNNERKMKKREYKKALKKACGLWKKLTVFSGILMGILWIAFAIVSIFDNTIAIVGSEKFWILENADPNAIYYKSEFKSNEEMAEYGIDLVKRVESEGAALLKNDNNALPISSNSKVSLFSTSSVNLVYGGTGSGNIDASTADNLKTALEKVGMTVNPTLWNFYLDGPAKKYSRPAGGIVSLEPASISEAPWDIYTDEVISSVSNYGDAAIVTFSRVGGEGADLEFIETNYLELNKDELDLLSNIAKLKKAGNINKIIVLINSANPLELDFINKSEYAIDSCLWIGDVGISGINGVAEILCGKVNPSGSLVDTYCNDNFSSPAMQNFIPTVYEGYNKQIPKNASTYMIYQEGIYVGYKYYETRYEDYVLNQGNAGDYNYYKDVAYPFGYGLSYTNFEYQNMSYEYDESNDVFKINVTVKNTGDKYSGKETVQVYAQAPYTEYDKQYGVEKASVQLVGFAKTKNLAPNESQTLSINVERRELASFDTYGYGTYILEAGDYYLTCATDAHNAVNNILAKKGNTVSSTQNRMDAEGNSDLVVKYTNDTLDVETYSKSKNGTTIKNQLSSADINLYEGIKEDQSITYLSRSDWNNTFPTEILKLELTDTMIKALQDVVYNPDNYDKIDMPTLGAKNGIKLYDLIGKDYNDPLWDKLLDQLEFSEMVSLIGDAFHWTMPVESVQAPGSRNENGPQGLTASLFTNSGGSGAALKATAFTSEDVMAATFNVELMTEIGNVIGNNCLAAEINVLYGPGNNTHRTPYGGRNFEYYSEDGFLAGMMSAYEVKAIQAKGVHVVMKHFALNDSEQDRIGLGVWLNEQAAREIYLKAFQYPFEIGDANGVMMAYTRWGCTWSGANYGLVTGIMRGEWGSNGMSITDNVLTTYVNGVDGILAGTSIYDAMLPHIVNQLPKYKDDAVIVAAMKEACHRNLYALANSCGMNGVGPNTTVKARTLPAVVTCCVLSIVFTVIFTGCLGYYIYKRIKFTETEDYKNYKQYINE
ncbi:MAG: glycoside hydrolase family 3 protein [Acholeplasmatales bacterium]|nr:glycoside hydrolase family 3 protein [Acholeplasmatales bacterium]